MKEANEFLNCLELLKKHEPNCKVILTMDSDYITSMFCDCVSLVDKDRIQTIFSVLFYSLSKPHDDITSTYLDVFLYGLYPANTGLQQVDSLSNSFFSTLNKTQACLVYNSLKILLAITDKLEEDFTKLLLPFWEKMVDAENSSLPYKVNSE
ncbi:MAG: hypothetical protein GX561_00960 [Lentisphaerae bacterium]|jgi:hypothetical protein|nr:hypothetical protein [Lentisphaerota bacterium]